MAAKTKQAEKKVKVTDKPVVAKTDDGGFQITFTVAWDEISSEMDKTALEMGEGRTFSGFRKGNAPLDVIYKNIPREQIVEHALQHILPKRYGEAIEGHKLRPITYPKFELISARDNEPWQIRARSAELPEIVLGDYKNKVKGALAAKSIWTPEKGDQKETPKEQTREEKEQIAINALLEAVEVNVPEMLVEEDANTRISQLLERLEKLGISLENYLSSIGKTAPLLREEYSQQSRQSIKLELLLGQIAENEGVEVPGDEIESFAEAARASGELTDNLKEERSRQLINSILMKRKVIDMLASL